MDTLEKTYDLDFKVYLIDRGEVPLVRYEFTDNRLILNFVEYRIGYYFLTLFGFRFAKPIRSLSGKQIKYQNQLICLFNVGKFQWQFSKSLLAIYWTPKQNLINIYILFARIQIRPTIKWYGWSDKS